MVLPATFCMRMAEALAKKNRIRAGHRGSSSSFLIYPSIGPLVHWLSIHLSMHHAVHPSISLSIHPFIHLSICPPTYVFCLPINAGVHYGLVNPPYLVVTTIISWPSELSYYILCCVPGESRLFLQCFCHHCMAVEAGSVGTAQAEQS